MLPADDPIVDVLRAGRFLLLPNCEPERAGESVVDHGARVLQFLLSYQVTATLSDRELQHADLAIHYAIIARGISVPAADRLSDVRHTIATVLRARARETASAPAIVAGGQLTGKLGTGGPGDREPLTPTPKNEPPAGATAELDAMVRSIKANLGVDTIQFGHGKDRIQF